MHKPVSFSKELPTVKIARPHTRYCRRGCTSSRLWCLLSLMHPRVEHRGVCAYSSLTQSHPPIRTLSSYTETINLRPGPCRVVEAQTPLYSTCHFWYIDTFDIHCLYCMFLDMCRPSTLTSFWLNAHLANREMLHLISAG